ncbi:MAG: hypothetical protein OXF24_06915 [Hyphomicrobiales bacterium]|nr:hypothetical protein [Hyphomicrobiales bacterium]
MTAGYLQLKEISYVGAKGQSSISFSKGTNVIYGASDTGKSFLVESIDFMLGKSKLQRDIPEYKKYNEIQLDFQVNDIEQWRFYRAVSGGAFHAQNLNENNNNRTTLKFIHKHDAIDNVSGFLLGKIGLSGKRILRKKTTRETYSFSFRNLVPLVVIQEGKIQQPRSPFLSGDSVQKTIETSAVRLLLTGNDDSKVISIDRVKLDRREISLINNLLVDIEDKLSDASEKNEKAFKDRLKELDISIAAHKESLDMMQKELNTLLKQRDEMVVFRTKTKKRIDEISKHLKRFELLLDHYDIDEERLNAIQESGSMFVYVKDTDCPLCGAPPDAQKHGEVCDGDVEAVVKAANAEVKKIKVLREELRDTVAELRHEATKHKKDLEGKNEEYASLNSQIQKVASPSIAKKEVSFSKMIEEKANIQRLLDLFSQMEKLKEKKRLLEQTEKKQKLQKSIITNIPNSVARDLSQKMSSVLKKWNFPGECEVRYDERSMDFLIDEKLRISRGKGLRAVTHAAVTISILEYCQERNLPHPGFVVLDSPLLAYYEPKGGNCKELQGTNLKELFYEYLAEHHAEESQVIIIENERPPIDNLKTIFFTGNSEEGRLGLL